MCDPPAGTSYPRKKGHVDGPSNSFRETGEHLDARNSVQKESVTGPATQYAYDVSRYTSRHQMRTSTRAIAVCPIVRWWKPDVRGGAFDVSKHRCVGKNLSRWE